MGWLGMARGLWKIGSGIFEADVKKIAQGATQTGGNALDSFILAPFFSEEIGKLVANGSDAIAGDEPTEA